MLRLNTTELPLLPTAERGLPQPTIGVHSLIHRFLNSALRTDIPYKIHTTPDLSPLYEVGGGPKFASMTVGTAKSLRDCCDEAIQTMMQRVIGKPISLHPFTHNIISNFYASSLGELYPSMLVVANATGSKSELLRAQGFEPIFPEGNVKRFSIDESHRRVCLPFDVDSYYSPSVPIRYEANSSREGKDLEVNLDRMAVGSCRWFRSRW